MVKKEEILEWASRNSVPYIEDPSNENVGFMRNKIRHDIMSHVLEVNPGIHKTLAKMIRTKYTR
jgi:tRNA(Ile)-lysidine synthase